MNPKEGNTEYQKWQAHARALQAEAIFDQILAGLEAELYIGLPVSRETAAVFIKGISGELVTLDEITGKYGEEPSEVLKFIGVLARKNAMFHHARKLKELCSEEVHGSREWNLRTSMDLFWEMLTRSIGGHRNEPILESAQNGWDMGTAEFLSAVGGEVPLLGYTKKLVKNLPVTVEKSVVG